MFKTSHTSTSGFYRPELDVVRFLAFFLVFLHHILPEETDPRILKLLGSWQIYFALRESCRFGLTLFFTLSAFLICELLLRERQATGCVKVKLFYFRRILRIWPLYYLALVLGVIVALLSGGNPAAVKEISWLSIFMGAWYLAHHITPANPDPGLWPLISGYVLASLGSVLAIVAFLGVSSKWLPGWAIYLGRISYGLYVYHLFALYAVNKLLVWHLASIGATSLLKFASILGLDVLMAVLSYHYFELRFLKLKRRYAVIGSQPIVGVQFGANSVTVGITRDTAMRKARYGEAHARGNGEPATAE